MRVSATFIVMGRDRPGGAAAAPLLLAPEALAAGAPPPADNLPGVIRPGVVPEVGVRVDDFAVRLAPELTPSLPPKLELRAWTLAEVQTPESLWPVAAARR